MTLEKAYELNEENKLPNGVTGIAVFDIDDTLVKANSSVIKIYKSVNGREIAISTAQFATDPDKEKMGKNVVYYNKTSEAPAEGIAFSIREFRDPVKVYNSITQGTPIIRNLRILDDKIKAGWDIAFLTARGLQGTVAKALRSYLKVRGSDGSLKPIGNQFKEALSAAVNDEDIKYIGKDDGEKKANVLRNIAKKYDRVAFIDDDMRNINAVRSSGIKTKAGENIRTIIAAKLTEKDLEDLK